jgi:hypothetical protein
MQGLSPQYGDIEVTQPIKHLAAVTAASLLAFAAVATPAVADDHGEDKGWLCGTLGVFCGDDKAKSDDKTDAGSATEKEADKAGSKSDDAAAKPAPAATETAPASDAAAPAADAAAPAPAPAADAPATPPAEAPATTP